MIKTKKLVDNISPKDKININNVDLDEIIYYKKKAGVAKGVLDIINPETGEVVYTGHNKILASGAEFLARQMFDLINSLLESFENEFKKTIAVVFFTSFMIAFVIGTIIIMTIPIVSSK